MTRVSSFPPFHTKVGYKYVAILNVTNKQKRTSRSYTVNKKQVNESSERMWSKLLIIMLYVFNGNMVLPQENCFVMFLRRLRCSIDKLEKRPRRVNMSLCNTKRIRFSMLEHSISDCSHINKSSQKALLRKHKLSFDNFISAFKIASKMNEIFQLEINDIITEINATVKMIEYSSTKPNNNIKLDNGNRIEVEIPKDNLTHEACQVYLSIINQYILT